MYNVKDMAFLNMPTRDCVIYGTCSRSKEYKIYEIEDKLSLEEKIAFINELEDGIASYLLDLFKKWEKEQVSLKKDSYGNVKTVSKKAWIKRNDTKGKIDAKYDIGKYYLFGTKYPTMTTVCPKTEWGYEMIYTGINVVHQWFHNLCDKLCGEELKYFESIDPIAIRIKK